MPAPAKAGDATVERHPHESRDEFQQHLADVVAVSNFGRRLKSLTPDEFIGKRWTTEPERSIPNPIHRRPGLNV